MPNAPPWSRPIFSIAGSTVRTGCQDDAQQTVRTANLSGLLLAFVMRDDDDATGSDEIAFCVQYVADDGVGSARVLVVTHKSHRLFALFFVVVYDSF